MAISLGVHIHLCTFSSFKPTKRRFMASPAKPRCSQFVSNDKRSSSIHCLATEGKEEPRQTIIIGGAYPSVKHGPARLINFTPESTEIYPENNTVNYAQENFATNLETEMSNEDNPIYKFFYPGKELLPDDKVMSIFDHLEELRQRSLISILAIGGSMLGCLLFSKELIILLEAPVSSQGVRFLQLSPGEFFFTSLKVSGYCGLLLGGPVVLYELMAFMLPGLTREEKRFLGPIVLGSSVLFYAGVIFSYAVLTPAALSFFVNYAEGAVESIWSIDQYFDFVLVLMFSTGLSFQVPVIQLLLGQLGLVSADQMLSVWRYVVVGAVTAAAVLTPSTDPLTQLLLAGPLLGLYFGGAGMAKLIGH